MPDQPAPLSELAIIQRGCSGGCGAILNYEIALISAPFVPDMHCLNGHSFFRGGHLCSGCEAAVCEVLARRREELQREAAARDSSQRNAEGRDRVRRRR